METYRECTVHLTEISQVAGVHTAGQIGCHFHVADLVLFHRLFHDGFYFIHNFLKGLVAVSSEIRLKVPGDLHLPILIDKIMPGLKTEHPFKKCFICGYELEGQIVSERVLVKDLVKLRMFHKSLDLRGKQKSSVHMRIIERFDPKYVPCGKKPFLFDIPNNERIHSPEPVHKPLSPLLISMDQRFRICV